MSDLNLINVLNGAVPYWVLRGTVPATLDFDFANGRYYQAGLAPAPSPGNIITTSRASSGYAADASGNYILFGNNVARITNQGLLIEEARTNSIRNNSMQGGSAPSTVPTNWSVPAVAGVTPTFSYGTDVSGVEYVDITYNGTPNATTSTAVVLDGTLASNIPAVNGQTWSSSVFQALSAGSLTNVGTISLRLFSITSGNVFSTTVFFQNFTPTAALTRTTASGTISDPSVAGLRPVVQFSVTNGQAINFTLRIGWPQLELGAFATSPIRTTNVAVIRAADVVTVTSPPLFGSAYTLFGKATPQAPATVLNNQTVLQLDDGTISNRSRIYRVGTTGNAALQVSIGGSSLLAIGSTNWPTSSLGRQAGAFATNSQLLSFNGGATTSGAVALPPITTISIGNAAGIQQFNGTIQEMAVFPASAQPAAQLQAWGTR